jgi:predicted nuclease with TOPRIM domain
MSQETNYSNQQQQTNATPPPPKKNNTWIFLAIIALLLGLVIYLFINQNRVSTERDQAFIERDSVTLDRDNIRSEYDAALARLDQLTTQNATMDSMINSKDGEIARLKKQIQGIITNGNATKADLKKARNLIATLNAKVKSYEERIAELEGENSKLTDENKSLSQERDSAVTENIGLQQKVRLGKVLHASNIRLEPIDLRRNGKKEINTSKAKRTDIFRVMFDIDENRIAEDGVQELYLRIIAPDGKLLSNAAYGSGVAATFDGQTLNYTMMKQINLKQNQKVNDVIADWNQESGYAKGNYTVEIYNDGYKIGNGTIKLK